jgi:hypothetical protein
MESKDIIVFVFVIAAVGFSLYRKYMKKNQNDSSGRNQTSGGSSFTNVKDDGYEPYSKK